MGNTVFYRNVQSNDNNVSWKDILSERKIKHSKEELEYAMTSGMAINSANEEDMLRKWHKPWVFNRVLIIGLILMAFIYGVYIAMLLIGGMIPVFELLATVVPPIVIPLAVLCFLWELNIPKNISIFELLGAFVVGGVLSIAISMLINVFVVDSLPMNNLMAIFSAALAPVAEEPGKFIAAIIVILFFQKKNKKIYGLTALILGAAVGAGFSAFESAQYVYNAYTQVGILGNFNIMFVRLFGSFGCHTLWASSYCAALGMACMAEKKLKAGAFAKWEVWKYFIIACLLHTLWNSIGTILAIILGLAGIGNILVLNVLQYILAVLQVLLQWSIFLKIVKKCLEQVISIGKYKSGTGMSYSEQMKGLRGGSVRQMNVAQSAQPSENKPYAQPVQQSDPYAQAMPQNAPYMQQSNNPYAQGTPQNAPYMQQNNPYAQGTPQNAPYMQQNNPYAQAMPQNAPYMQQNNPYAQGMPQNAPYMQQTQNVHYMQPAPVPEEEKGTVALFASDVKDEEATERMPQPTLSIRCIDGFLAGKEWQTKSRISIGRSENSNIRFEAAASGVSRNHCEIYLENGSWMIKDNNSTNGTFVNGVKVATGGVERLYDGAEVRLSNSGQIFVVNCRS